MTDQSTGQQVSGTQAVDRVLARTIRDLPVRSVRYLTDRLVTLLDPDRKERYDEDAHLRRGVHLTTVAPGMGILRATLTPADTAILKALLAAWGKPDPSSTCLVQHPDGGVQEVLVRDERTLPMRHCDALMATIRAAAGTDDRANARPTGSAPTGTAATAAAATAADCDAGDAASTAFVRSHDATDGTSTGSATPALTLLITATLEQVHGLRGAGQATLDRVGPISDTVFEYLTCAATLTRSCSTRAASPSTSGGPTGSRPPPSARPSPSGTAAA